MRKPNGYDEASATMEYKTIRPGGHRCLIHKVEECNARNGSEYIKVTFDTTFDDIDPEVYMKKWRSDTRTDKKWGGVMTIFITDPDGFTTPQFKGFCTSLEQSNPGYKINWDDSTTASMAKKVIGLVFREEEFEKQDGTVGVAVKAAWACDINKAAEQDIPKRRVLKTNNAPAAPIYVPNTPAPANYAPNFTPVEGDDDLPF